MIFFADLISFSSDIVEKLEREKTIKPAKKSAKSAISGL